MKTIGLLGGMHWESTAAYYHTINAVVREQIGGVHSAQCLICSVDYHPIRQSLVAGQWGDVAACRLRAAGFSRVGLVGTRQVMEQEFHREPLERLGLTVITSGEEERRWCHELIFRELWCGSPRAPDRKIMRRMLDGMAARGAQVLLVACTALAPHLTRADSPIPLWESDSPHVHEAALVGLEEVPLPE
ncbi:aspartate/glutamate racemase family protein [uncultured Desulfovibrio sp.]|uniref:aspartate/glutamate racemase family protein n=1 Tax=uncultured Desulfovibrio sp. TaxID=167968 RepID=UPI002631A015|nr:aspartate/glutamate racemase family protein [uncultured Desulfovibrio sp.]